MFYCCFFSMGREGYLGWGGIGCKWKWGRDMILYSYNVQISSPFTFKYLNIHLNIYIHVLWRTIIFVFVSRKCIFKRSLNLLVFITINKGKTFNRMHSTCMSTYHIFILSRISRHCSHPGFFLYTITMSKSFHFCITMLLWHSWDPIVNYRDCYYFLMHFISNLRIQGS